MNGAVPNFLGTFQSHVHESLSSPRCPIVIEISLNGQME